MTWTHLRDELGRAKKPRACCLCGRRIEPDVVRVKRFGTDSREFVRMDMHIECEVLTKDWGWMDWETHSPGDGEWPEIEADEVRTKQAKGG